MKKLRTPLQAQAIEHGLNPILALGFSDEQLEAWIAGRAGKG